jgi:hypothetical protein
MASSIRKKLAITSPTSGGRSVGIVRSRTQTMEFSFFFLVQIFTPFIPEMPGGFTSYTAQIIPIYFTWTL